MKSQVLQGFERILGKHRDKHIFLCLSMCLVFITCFTDPFLNFNGEQVTCESANDGTDDAADDFENMVNAENYTALCLAYKSALANQIALCGDESEDLSVILERLGDCQLSSFFQVDFDGQTFFSDRASGTITGGKITIEAFRGPDGEKVEIELNEAGVGTYQFGLTDLNDRTNAVRYTTEFNNLVVWESISDGTQIEGEITITEIDYANSWISGTFSFTGHNNGEKKEFTNGQFSDIPFEKGNEFFAKVDGEEFVDVIFLVDDGNFGSLAFSVRDADNRSITIGMDPNISSGTYSFNNFPDLPSSDYTPFSNDFHSGEGTITIIQHSITAGVIVGTFEFAALPVLGGVGTYEITEGSFCMYY